MKFTIEIRCQGCGAKVGVFVDEDDPPTRATCDKCGAVSALDRDCDASGAMMGLWAYALESELREET